MPNRLQELYAEGNAIAAMLDRPLAENRYAAWQIALAKELLASDQAAIDACQGHLHQRLREQLSILGGILNRSA